MSTYETKDPLGETRACLRSDKVGLSNEERYSGIVHVVEEITECNNNFWRYGRPPYVSHSLKHIAELIVQLWPALNKTRTNGMFWITGNSANEIVPEYPKDLWGIAVRHNIDTFLCAVRHNNERHSNYSEPFNALDESLSIRGLLEEPEASFVYEVFAMCESLAYYLRRYHDDFLKELSELNNILSRLEGECFHKFKYSDSFTQAYLIHNICKDIYGNGYPYNKKQWDSLTHWLQNNFSHHEIKSGSTKLEFKEVVKIYHVFMSSKKKKIDRLIAALKLAYSSFYYEHDHKKLMSMVEKDPELKCGKRRIQAILKANIKARKEREKKEKKQYPPPDPLAVFGYGFDFKEVFAPRKVEEDNDEDEE